MEKLETNCLAKHWAAKHVNPVCAINSAELIIIKAVVTVCAREVRPRASEMFTSI